MFKPVSDQVALSQKIVTQITDAIIRGDVAPGDKIPTERKLAEEFGVSRTAIRDAIKILSGRGVLEVRHGVGIFVANEKGQPSYRDDVSWQDAKIRDLFEVRQTLETQTSALAALRASDQDVERLQCLLDDARAQTHDLGILAERDAQFHMAIAEGSKNLLMVKVMWNLLDALADSRRTSLAIPMRAVQSLDEHQHIVNAIANRDSSAARRLMDIHLSSVKHSIDSSQ